MYHFSIFGQADCEIPVFESIYFSGHKKMYTIAVFDPFVNERTCHVFTQRRMAKTRFCKTIRSALYTSQSTQLFYIEQLFLFYCRRLYKTYLCDYKSHLNKTKYNYSKYCVVSRHVDHGSCVFLLFEKCLIKIFGMDVATRPNRKQFIFYFS